MRKEEGGQGELIEDGENQRSLLLNEPFDPGVQALSKRGASGSGMEQAWTCSGTGLRLAPGSGDLVAPKS